MSNLAIIPVRTGSKRLPEKNTVDFFGKPMFMHAVCAAQESGLFEEVHVSTESEEVADICREHGLDVKFLRTMELASDTVGLEAVCEYSLGRFEQDFERTFDSFCLLWATAPLRRSDDIVKAYALLDEDADAVVSVTNYDLPVFCAQTVDERGFLTPMFPDMMWLPSQEMPDVLCDNGCLCWVRVKPFREEGVWMPKRTKPYIMHKLRSVDIDTKEDLLLARFYYDQHSK